MAPYDPVAEFGTQWRRFNDGSFRRVVISGGRYCFEDQRTGDVTPIPGAVSPPPRREEPRSNPIRDGQHLNRPKDRTAPRGDHQPRPNPNFTWEESGTGSRESRKATDGNPAATHQDVSIRVRQSPQQKPAVPANIAPTGGSGDVLEFIRIPFGKIADCESFISRNEHILGIDLRTIVDAAVQALRNEDHMGVKRCIQSYVIIKACKNFAEDGREAFFYHLKKQDPDGFYWQNYQRDSDQILKEVERRFSLTQPQDTLETTSRIQGADVAKPALQGYGQSPYGQNFARTSYSGPGVPAAPYGAINSASTFPQGPVFPTTTQSGSFLASGGFTPQRPANISTSSTQGQSALEYERGIAQFSAPITRADKRQDQYSEHSNPQKDSTVARSHPRRLAHDYQDHEYKHKLPTAGGIQNVQFRGKLQVRDSNRLDRRYLLRDDASKFFEKGRVFAMMFHEGRGLQYGKLPDDNPDEDDDDDPHVTKGPQGVKIYSHIRRMAVIRQREGYCICVPISSYRRGGIGKKKMSIAEMQAHAIAYSSDLGSAPERLRGEPAFRKRPIAIDLCEGHGLDKASRIHFGKTYTIEWNIQVMDIGRIASDSMADFEKYWMEELCPPK